ncbi:MAG: hypothetical protein ACKVP3_05810 [Hyphomicrobiaceae bacterium]
MPIVPISPTHSCRALIDWALVLLPLTDAPTYANAHARLAQLHPQPARPDLKAVLTQISGREALFNPAAILRTIICDAELSDHDLEFGWKNLEPLEPSQAISERDLPWELREEARFAVGAYEPVPWAHEFPPIAGHYAHLSSDKPGLIAYTQTAAKGEADRQTQIRPGRYLAQFYPELLPETIRRLVNGVPKPATLAFARTADEIEQVYLSGPQSCMSHPLASYASPCHPVRVYGDSDLALAYATPPKGTPTARALVWPERKRFGRIYGDETLLERLLEGEGYESGDFSGARIRRIPANPDDHDQVVMPYLDSCRSFDVVDEHWLQIEGPYDACRTDGIGLLEERSPCARCEEHFSELYNVGDERWCDGCRDQDAFCSDFSDEYFSQSLECEVIVRRKDGNNHVVLWAESERDEHATYCDGSHESYKSSVFEFVELKNGETWVAWYFEEEGDPDDLANNFDVANADNDNAAVGERDAA